MTVAKLVHVGTIEVLAARLIEDEEKPAWHDAADGELGQVTVRPWTDTHLMVRLTGAATGDQHAVRVTVGGLYALDDSNVEDLSEQQIDDFARDRLAELMPFLRQAMFTASSSVWPVKPIMIDISASVPELAS